MIEIQTLDELERKVRIAELQAQTIEVAFHSDLETVRATERLAALISSSLDEHRPEKRSTAVAPLFALKVRIGAALNRMRSVSRSARLCAAS